jgi:hypothetical protein
MDPGSDVVRPARVRQTDWAWARLTHVAPTDDDRPIQTDDSTFRPISGVPTAVPARPLSVQVQPPELPAVIVHQVWGDAGSQAARAVSLLTTTTGLPGCGGRFRVSGDHQGRGLATAAHSTIKCCSHAVVESQSWLYR